MKFEVRNQASDFKHYFAKKKEDKYGNNKITKRNTANGRCM